MKSKVQILDIFDFQFDIPLIFGFGNLDLINGRDATYIVTCVFL